MASKVIGPPAFGVCGVDCVFASCAAAGSGARPSERVRTSIARLVMVLRPQADVDVGAVAAADVDVGDVGAEAGLLDLDGVAALGDLNHQPLLLWIAAVPRLAVDAALGVTGMP